MDERTDQEKVEGESQEVHRSWQQRHGATLIAVVAVLMLVLLIAFQMNC
jgi:hypothetical protein